MKKTLILTQKDIARLADMKTAMLAVETAFRAQALGKVIMPPKVYMPLPDGSDFRAMPACVPALGACGIKWVNVHPSNQRRAMPTVMGIVIINDPKTGFPTAIIDGLSITRLRTGASAAVAAKALARRESSTVSLIGCGAQAHYQLLGLNSAFRIKQVKVWGYRRGEAAQFCKKEAGKFAFKLIPSQNIKECVLGSDIVVTITSSRKVLVYKQWIKPGTHINAIGADAPGKQELDPEILKKSIIVVDDLTQALHGGEINVPISKGLLKPSSIHANLGDILIGRKRTRTTNEQITVFDSTGIAIHDVALARAIVQKALRLKIGHFVSFFKEV
jgi:alanine dehydrogenase